MNKESLMLFIKRIPENGSPEKTFFSLCQLKEILETQGADPAMSDPASMTLVSIPEAKSAAGDVRAESASDNGVNSRILGCLLGGAAGELSGGVAGF